MTSLNFGYYITVGLSIAGMYFVTNSMLNEQGGAIWFFYAGVVGILTSLAFVFITQYYTAGSWRPVKEIAEATKTGPATTIISGIAVGYETTASSVITIAIALFLSHFFGEQWGAATGLPHGGIYGTAVATMGMLMSAAFILAMDTFGPITDNAGGVASMANASHETRERTDRLDAVGNTTKALTKGYAVASAALAAFLLFSAYLDKVTDLRRAAGIKPADFHVGTSRRSTSSSAASSARCSSTSSRRSRSVRSAARAARSSRRSAPSSASTPGSWPGPRSRTTRGWWTSPRRRRSAT